MRTQPHRCACLWTSCTCAGLPAEGAIAYRTAWNSSHRDESIHKQWSLNRRLTVALVAAGRAAQPAAGAGRALRQHPGRRARRGRGGCGRAQAAREGRQARGRRRPDSPGAPASSAAAICKRWILPAAGGYPGQFPTGRSRKGQLRGMRWQSKGPRAPDGAQAAVSASFLRPRRWLVQRLIGFSLHQNPMPYGRSVFAARPT